MNNTNLLYQGKQLSGKSLSIFSRVSSFNLGDYLPEEITVLESIRRFDKIVPRAVDVTHVVPDLQTQTAHALKCSQSTE